MRLPLQVFLTYQDEAGQENRFERDEKRQEGERVGVEASSSERVHQDPTDKPHDV
jgi:hypothetical protein